MIHPSAIIDPQAEIDSDVAIGPYVVIDGPVKIGAGTRVHSHAHLSGWTTIGRKCEIHPFAVVGNAPQDYSYENGRSYVNIGDRTIVREYASIHRGSEPESTTSIGSGCMIMAKAHVGHNCSLGDGVVLTNGADCAGHVEIGDHALISANVLIHQFARVGRRAMCVGTGRISRDVPPFLVAGYDGGVSKVNTVGLRRGGFSEGTIEQIKTVFKSLYRSAEPFRLAVERLTSQSNSPEVDEILEFIASASKRGIAGPTSSRR